MNTNTAIVHMLKSTLYFAIVNFSVKSLTRIPAYEIVFFRALITALISFYIIKKMKLSPWGNNKKYLFLRGFFGTLALFTFFYTLQKLPLATAVTIQYLSPIFTAIIATFILKERTKPYQWLFFFVSFTGILAMNGFKNIFETNIIYLIGIASAIFSAFAYNFVRKLKDYDDPLVVVFYFPLVTIPIIGPYTIYNWINPIGIEWIYIIAVGIFTQLAQVEMTKAYQLEKFSVISNFNYLGSIYALIIGFIFFGEILSLNEFIGIFLIIFGVLLSSKFK